MSAQLPGLRRLLDREAELLVRRLRGFSERRYAAAAPPFDSRAQAAAHLAETLAVAAQGLAAAAAAAEPSWRRLPQLPAMALADAVAVTAHDLLVELADPPTQAWTPAGRRPTVEVCAGMLAEVLLHRRDVDGSAPGTEAAAGSLAVLLPGRVAGPGPLLAEAARRCPAYRRWLPD